MLRDEDLVSTEMATQVLPNPKSSAPNIYIQATLERFVGCVYAFIHITIIKKRNIYFKGGGQWRN